MIQFVKVVEVKALNASVKSSLKTTEPLQRTIAPAVTERQQFPVRLITGLTVESSLLILSTRLLLCVSDAQLRYVIKSSPAVSLLLTALFSLALLTVTSILMHLMAQLRKTGTSTYPFSCMRPCPRSRTPLAYLRPAFILLCSH
jgi:hypothetical protein